ncbi:MAG: 4Fe-4S binding protein [Acidiferrobacterales bacterium]|nr:4Fe-4S binding protein [Acidiferrobacterales bacterium]
MTLTEQFELPALTENGKARLASFEALSVEPTPTSLVAYQSLGQVVIAGARSSAIKAARNMVDTELTCYLLITEEDDEADTDHQGDTEYLPQMFSADDFSAQGYLGAFSIIAFKNDREFDFGKTVGIASGLFDLILDLSESSKFEAQVPPPGYFRIEPAEQSDKRIRRTAEELSQLVGNFEKPKYFNYDPDICAHSRSGIVACTRCIDACPTDAITSIGETIEFNSHLCQGGGVCAAACPTGAATYAYPPSENQLDVLRQLLLRYRENGGHNAVVLFYDREGGTPIVSAQITEMGENILPVQVEEVGALGLDIFFSLLAYGAAGAAVLCSDVAQSVRQELEHQIEILDRFLEGMGHSFHPIQLMQTDEDREVSESAIQQLAQMDISPAKFAPTGIKRTDMRIALEHLHSQSPKQPDSINLPGHSPFGQIMVDTDTCTLCMGCVSVCPASALEAGGEVPKLAFIENNCVQCGLCESACPESSITRSQRYLFDTDSRMRARTMNEDAPFHCRVCGKAFATSAMLRTMKDKLKGHWMFQDPEAVARLEMCEDCRVKDMFAAEGGFPRNKI